jgi:hypothetical protein
MRLLPLFVLFVPALAAAELPDQVSKQDILTGVNAVRTQITRCRMQHGDDQLVGTVKVLFMIEPTGKVSSARAEGDLASTWLAKCCTDALLTATFPPFKGEAQAVRYPFTFR